MHTLHLFNDVKRVPLIKCSFTKYLYYITSKKDAKLSKALSKLQAALWWMRNCNATNKELYFILLECHLLFLSLKAPWLKSIYRWTYHNQYSCSICFFHIWFHHCWNTSEKEHKSATPALDLFNFKTLVQSWLDVHIRFFIFCFTSTKANPSFYTCLLYTSRCV